jgi:hypothetical protein
MGTYEPNEDYRTLKPYKLKPDLVDMLGGVTAEKANELYQGRKQNALYLSLPIYPIQQDPLTRTLMGYRGNPNLQPDMVAAKRALVRH